jgi:tetratricopeptide (TPR) repeat protein
MIVDDTPPPFWERIRDISTYPAQADALMTVGVLSVFSLTMLIGGLVGLFFYLLTLAYLYKYCFEVLRASANGRLEAPTGGLSSSSSDSSGWGAIGLQILLTIAVVVAFRFGGALIGFATVLIVVLALPGVAMSYAMDQNFWHALSPLTWFEIMGRIGAGYFAAFGLVLVILASSAAVQNFLAQIGLPTIIALPLVFFASGYGLVAAFHLMGYLIYQYHDQLGYEPDVQKPLARTASDPDQELLDDVAQMLQDGEIDMAYDTMRQHVRSRGGTDAVHTQYRKLLRMKGDAAELKRHGEEWLAILLGQDKEKAAVDIARELVELDPAFVPKDAEATTRLAQRAAALNQTQLALRLVNGFHKRHPKSADIPANYLLAARLLSERMGKDAEAKALLMQLKTAFPNHALAGDIDALLRIVESAPGKKPA